MHPVVVEYSATAYVIAPTAPLERLLRDMPLEDVVEALARLVPLARKHGLSRADWLPTFLVAEGGSGRFGLCLDGSNHPAGAHERRVIEEAMIRLHEHAPTDGPIGYDLIPDMDGAPHAPQATFRLRTEYWRWLAGQVAQSLERALLEADRERDDRPATPLLARAWRGARANPLSEFASSLGESATLEFARDVARGPDALHLRVSVLVHLLALRSVRFASGRAYHGIEALFGELLSEVVGEYHLDGQAAVRALCEAPRDERLEVPVL